MSTAPSEVLMPSKATKTKKAKAADQSDVISQIGQFAEQLTKEEAIKAAFELQSDVDYHYFKLGGVLSAIYSNEWWKEPEYPDHGFKQFLEQRLGIHYRKAMYLIQIYDDLIESGVMWSDVSGIGWSILKELTPILTKENVKEWVSKAQGMTKLEVQAMVAAYKADKLPTSGVVPEEPKSTTTSMSFKVHEDQKETIQQALVKARKEAETEYDAVALEAICINYLAGGKVSKPKSLKAVLEKYTPEEVLTTFEQCWPDIDVSVSL